MLKKILIAAAIVVVGLVAVIATRPSTFAIERSTTIDAPSGVIYGYLEDFHRWPEWSPWDKLDPSQKRNYEGEKAGKGAIYSWSGNDQVGEGRMTITEASPKERVALVLEFLKPWKATNDVTFVLAESKEGTKLTWRMEGTNDFMGKAFSLVMDMDSMVGKDFENGLASLKTLGEAEAKKLVEEQAAREAAEKEAAEKAAAEAVQDAGSKEAAR
ncbi:SRPBCC family protein [Vulgatibacter incomptus]|uniref:Polyketide cyclase n=1 Tax=Vulgatibacter incomptus TaxID=1391653 RepID=A0A0K1PHX0_9BACT|nr:SRPBCC family protein [Vulgatibacter incomptus]AKU93120.1 hypothetical protein AKJ08_3507 [Vulgatibacter incomptus]